MKHLWYIASIDECLTIETEPQANPLIRIWRVRFSHEDGGSVRYAIMYFRGEWVANREPSPGSHAPIEVIHSITGLVTRMNQKGAYVTRLLVSETPDLDLAIQEVIAGATLP